MTKQNALKCVIAICGFLLFTGCTSKAGLFVKSFTNPTPYHEFTLEDGTKSLCYEIEKNSTKSSNTIIFFITGSGYSSLQYYFKHYFEDLDFGTKIYALQKRGVENRTTGLLSKPAHFDGENVFENWVHDNRFFIEHIMAKPENREKEVILFGVSEGANVAAKIASTTNAITHLVIVGSGGLSQAEELKLLYPKQKNQFEEIYEDIQ